METMVGSNRYLKLQLTVKFDGCAGVDGEFPST
jgi:hypothetical protein